MPFYRKEWSQMAKRGAIPDDLASVPSTEPTPDTAQLAAIEAQLTQQAEFLLKQQIAAEPLKGENNFLNYVIDKSRVFFSGMYSKIYAATNPSIVGETVIICRIFQPTAEIDPIQDLHLKVLRFIGRHCPSIISTMDIFYDDTRLVYLFQEYADGGNCLDYLRAGNYVTPTQMIRWSGHIWSALDFLGDNALVHMNLHPKHVMLKLNKPDDTFVAKLGGFRDVKLYWDVAKKDIVEFPKRPWEYIRYPTFKGPETHSKQADKETFNPIEADVWSFGATFFYILARTYPFDPNGVEDLKQADDAIQKRVWATLKMDDGCKAWFYSMLRADPANRLKFEDILKDSWYMAQTSTQNNQNQSQTNA